VKVVSEEAVDKGQGLLAVLAEEAGDTDNIRRRWGVFVNRAFMTEIAFASYGQTRFLAAAAGKRHQKAETKISPYALTRGKEGALPPFIYELVSEIYSSTESARFEANIEEKGYFVLTLNNGGILSFLQLCSVAPMCASDQTGKTMPRHRADI
jgi:hypothetical protein